LPLASNLIPTASCTMPTLICLCAGMIEKRSLMRFLHVVLGDDRSSEAAVSTAPQQHHIPS
jgi:hypothetical protein